MLHLSNSKATLGKDTLQSNPFEIDGAFSSFDTFSSTSTSALHDSKWLWYQKFRWLLQIHCHRTLQTPAQMHRCHHMILQHFWVYLQLQKYCIFTFFDFAIFVALMYWSIFSFLFFCWLVTRRSTPTITIFLPKSVFLRGYFKLCYFCICKHLHWRIDRQLYQKARGHLFLNLSNSFNNLLLV